MAGKKGMIRKPGANAVRRKVWQSMRIFRRFTVPDLCRTSGARRNNVRKFLRNLEEHGYIMRHGSYVSGRPGSCQVWRLVKDCGPDYPSRCDRCGRSMQEPCEKEDE